MEKRRVTNRVCKPRVLVGKPEGKSHWGDLGVDGWIILGRISRRWDVCIWTELGRPRIQTGGGIL